MPLRLAFVAAALLAGFTACGSQDLRPDAGRPDVPGDGGCGAAPTLAPCQPPSLPLCLTNGSLLSRPVSEMKACAPEFCAMLDAPPNGIYLYCRTGCGQPCAEGDQFRVTTKADIVTALD